MPKSLRSALSEFRLFVFGPRRVEDVMRTFKAAAEDLEQTVAHNRAQAQGHAAQARAHNDLEIIYNAEADRARRVGVRIQALLS